MEHKKLWIRLRRITYLDSCAGCVFRERTPAKVEELMAKIS
jgi:hypothetical protein